MKKIWDWYYGKASIRKKLIISYLILVILPILVLGMYSYYVSKKNLIRQTKHTMESNVDAISYSLQNDIQRETDNIKYLSYNAKLRGSLENGLKNRNALVKEMNDSVEPTFWYFIASDDKIKGIEIYSPYVKQSLGSFLKPLEGKEKRSWFRKNQNNFKTEWSVKDDRIYATRMILDSATSSTVIGYMRLEVFADEFLDGLFQSSYLNNGILLVDANGKKITERTIKDREINKNIKNNLDASFILWDVDTLDWRYRDVDYLVNYTLENITDKDIILFHDIHKTSISTIEKLLPLLYVNGYQVLTVSDLAKTSKVTLENHKSYRNFK